MKYVIIENETGTQHIFETFTEVMKYIETWHGDTEMSEEQKTNIFIQHHQTFVI
jgi:hypothetical protein